ncbi:MAG TPA: 2-oxoacid:acceptor oxidoreductase family protein [Clostridia bacterium]|nr:2-oxoacid:acceptor oxidoreductase family protein [Clostridia bacterium]
MRQKGSKTMRILIAGFGGQGVLFLGKLIAHAGVLLGKHVTWLPSYGPEMRGGTANCAVILSDEPIGSPMVSEPDVLIAMNLPSLTAYQPRVQTGGEILYDASLIREAPEREDVRLRALPATKLASDAGLEGLANMILLGAFLSDCLPLNETEILHTLEQTVPRHKAHLIEANRHAIAIGKQTIEQTEQELHSETKRISHPRKVG